MKKGIILRDKCPICNSTSSKSIFNRSFNEDLIKEYMNEIYQKNSDIAFLEDVIFEIVKCNECNFSVCTAVRSFVSQVGPLNKLISTSISNMPAKAAQNADQPPSFKTAGKVKSRSNNPSTIFWILPTMVLRVIMA